MSELWETPEQLDSAIDALLGQPGWLVPIGEGSLLATARLLRDSLPRLHPRFGFEEQLSRRLLASGSVPGAGATIVPFHRPGMEASGDRRVDAASLEPAGHAPVSDGRRRRNLVAGGAIASGVSLAIPLAGAAVVAWRRLRASGGFS
jgi:hypothetical protein